MPIYRKISAPNLPTSPPQYSNMWHEQFSNVLRLFFNQLVNRVNAPKPYASYYDTASHAPPSVSNASSTTSTGTAGAFTVTLGGVITGTFYVGQAVVGTGIGVGAFIAAVSGSTLTLTVKNTATVSGGVTAYPIYAIPLNTKAEAYNVDINPNGQITVIQSGVYNVQFSVQFENTDVADQDAQIWLRQNNVDVVDSNGYCSVPSKHGGVNGHTVVSWNYVLSLAAQDTLQFLWNSSSTAVSLKYYAATTSPPVPATPSTILTINWLSDLAI